MDDQAFLRTSERPPYEVGQPAVRLVDLFSGCGGLTLGLAESAHRMNMGIDVALAVDFDESIAGVYGVNFPKARVETCGVEVIFDGALGSSPTSEELRWRRRIGRISWLQGGPPCQGHSDLNNHTRRRDPRNRFYERMARAAEVLQPDVVLIENVPSVRNDTDHVVDRTGGSLTGAGYDVADAVIAFGEIGIPQRRRRHTILALKNVAIGAKEVLASIDRIDVRDLYWAIGDLDQITEKNPLDRPSRSSPANRERMEYLLATKRHDLPNSMRPGCHQGDHSYKSMYGRLKWTEPAQTITTGFGSMGQGRYMHPTRPRTLTPHEAARIQGFPDWFDFTAGGRELRRGAWATMIGNAVPPKLTMELGRLLLPELAV